MTERIISMTVAELRSSQERVVFGRAQSSIGPICAVLVGNRIAAVHFNDEVADTIQAAFKQWPGVSFSEDDEEVQCVLSGVFDEPASACGMMFVGTDFQCAIWRALMDIRAGTVETYSQVAKRVGRPSAVRAVASAIARNPLAVLVPCHRVVPASGGTGAYRWGKDRKISILASEGAL